jgi:phosphatidylinositol alpha-1,6-mannosyltransferase
LDIHAVKNANRFEALDPIQQGLHDPVAGLTSRRGNLLPLRPGLLLTPDFPPQLGGIARYLYSLYSQFDLSRMKVITPRRKGYTEFDSAHEYIACRYQALDSPPGIRGFWQLLQTYWLAAKLVRHDRSQVIHCGQIYSAMAALTLKRRYGTPYLVWTHALEIMDDWLLPLVRPTLLHADLVLTNSEFTRSFIESMGLPASRIVKVQPGADVDRFQPDHNARQSATRLGIPPGPVLLTLGTLSKNHRYKGQDMVIRALPTVLRSVPDLMYVIAGSGKDDSYLYKVAQEVGVTQHVKILGRVDEADVPLLYNCCDVFIMCSRQERTRRGILAEGFGIVFLEASATGKPVIGGLSGGIPDAVRDGVTGLLVDPHDPSAIAFAILRLFCEPELARSLGRNGRKWIEEQMTWDRAAAQFRIALDSHLR